MKFSKISKLAMTCSVLHVPVSNADSERTFYAPGSNDRGHIAFVLSVCLFVCLSVCLFVCLLSTLTLAITFEPLEIETSYLACILH